MRTDPQKISYGRWSFEPNRNLLFVDGEIVRLQRGVLSLFQYLVHHEGRVVTKEELIEAVWDGREISDAALYNRVGALRKALVDDNNSERCIQWEYGRGLRFLRPKGSHIEAEPEARSPLQPTPPEHKLPTSTYRTLATSPIENWRYILGTYNTFYRTPSWPGMIKVGVTVLKESDDHVAVWTSERGEDPQVGIRQRARYQGSAVFINGRVYVTEQNSEPPHSVCLSTLDAPHAYRPDIMKGLMHGSSWRLGGAPYATRVVWQRVPPEEGLRGALKKSGPYPNDTHLIEPAILKSVGPDCLTFHDQTSEL